MFSKKPIAVAVVASMLCSAPVHAGVGQGMRDMFDSMGGYTNSTPPSAYKTQTMNGYSGGGFYLRTPVKNYNLASVTAPSLNIGCGGIDLTAGAFSFINKAALTGLLQNIGTSLGYAFLLAIKSSMPEMASLFESLQDTINKVNRSQINACQLTSGIPFKDGGSLSENLSAIKTHLAGSNITNMFSDALASLEATKDDAAARRNVANAAIAADSSKEELFKPGNVIWRVLSRRSGLDTQDKEFIMSLVGSIVITEPSGAGPTSTAPKWIPYPPLINDIDGLVGPVDPNAGATITIYKCGGLLNESGCLTMTPVNIPITSFTKMVSQKIDSLQDNLITRSQQTVSDFKLVDVSSVPIWRLITSTANINPGLVNNYKRMVAVDVAYQYISGLLTQARQLGLYGKSEAQSDDAKAAIKELTDRLVKLEEKLQTDRLVEASKVQNMAEVERQLQLLEQSINAGMPAQAFNSMQIFK